ncbi:MAG: FAD:protein FMN transferase [Gallionella sp.]|nr:FAD:protein FMN transferase [Gallionella sp.]MDD4945299.1 FAD:protein FMN transferase [Gallionella sp.]MDD5613418.1 FAD:protein FMN transferase [Gallionella sp.]
MRHLLALCVALLLAGCAGKEPLYQEQGYVFGTLVEVSVYGEDDARARAAVAEVLHEFQRLHEMLHAWKPSELSRLNAAFAQGQSLAVSPELAAMMADAAQLSARSQGLFNPSIGGLVQLWGFHADEFKPVEPAQQQIAQWLAANPQMSDLVFSTPNPPQPSLVRGAAFSSPDKVRPGGVAVFSRNRAVQLDLGGYAKGYALDRAAALLHRQGIRNALVNIGGNIIALGRHGDRAWRVGIQHPRNSGALATLELRDGEAIGTSGDYQRYFMLQGKRYCHLIDPRTGYPVQGVQAVTVLTHGAQAGVRSDVVSKPLFIAGVQGWRAEADRMGVAEAMLVDGAGRIHLTGSLQNRLEFTDKKIIKQVE